MLKISDIVRAKPKKARIAQTEKWHSGLPANKSKQMFSNTCLLIFSELGIPKIKTTVFIQNEGQICQEISWHLLV